MGEEGSECMTVTSVGACSTATSVELEGETEDVGGHTEDV